LFWISGFASRPATTPFACCLLFNGLAPWPSTDLFLYSLT